MICKLKCVKGFYVTNEGISLSNNNENMQMKTGAPAQPGNMSGVVDVYQACSFELSIESSF